MLYIVAVVIFFYHSAINKVLASGTLVGVGDDAGGGAFESYLSNFLVFTNNVLIPFLLAMGFLVFVFGIVRYFTAGATNEVLRESGKSLAIYGILAFVLIIVFWGIVNLIANSIGLQPESAGSAPGSLQIRNDDGSTGCFGPGGMWVPNC